MISRFLLLSFDYVRPHKDPTISLAAASLMAQLRTNAHRFRPNFQLFHRRLDVANDPMEEITDQVIDCVRDVRPDVLGVGLYVWNECYVSRNEMKVIGRPQLRKRIVEKSQQLVANDIPFEISLIYGLPLQTIHSFQETIDFVEKEVRPNRVRAWPLMLLKGTELFHRKHEYDLREKVLDPNLMPVLDMRQFGGIPHVVSSSTFTEEEWLIMKSMADELNSKGNNF